MSVPNRHPARRLTRPVVVLVLLITPALWAQQERAYTPKPNRDNVETEMELLLDDAQALQTRIALRRAELDTLEVHLDETNRAIKGREGSHLSELERARDRVRWVEQMVRNGRLREPQLRAERLTLERLESVGRRLVDLRKLAAPRSGQGSGSK
jgi:hypothetical protein